MTLCLNPACSARNAPNAQFCIKCGKKLLRLVPLVCLNQGCIDFRHSHAPDAEFCMKCGGKLEPVPPVSRQQLEALLAAGEWQEADEETAKVMREVANQTKNRPKNCPLDPASIDDFPCEDLRAIDGLWVKYSNGRFGFSVQKRIYQSLGGTRNYNQQVFNNFGDRVGWRKGGSWLWYKNITLDYKNITFKNKVPFGHLPMLVICGLCDQRGRNWAIGDEVDYRSNNYLLRSWLFSRIETCKL